MIESACSTRVLRLSFESIEIGLEGYEAVQRSVEVYNAMLCHSVSGCVMSHCIRLRCMALCGIAVLNE